MNKTEAKKRLTNIRNKHLASGTDLKVAIVGTDYIILWMFIAVVILNNVSCISLNFPYAPILVIIGIVFTLVLLVFLFCKFTHLKAVRDYLVDHNAQNLDDINE